MTRIILHIGPEKCGSTSIQRAMAEASNDRHFLLLDPYLVIGLDSAKADRNAMAALTKEIATKLSEAPDKALIVSHEMIFKSQHILRAMATICTDLSDTVDAIMYVRRQSDFAVSGFGQWHFRSPERLREARAVLQGHDIDGSVFYGVERHLMAGLLGNWRVFRQPSGHLYLDWLTSVSDAQRTLASHNVGLSVGALPRAGFSGDLIGDFLQRAALTGDTRADLAARQNQSFPPALIEATVNAIEAGHAMPGPHEANDFFARTGQLALHELVDDGFLTVLKSHIDTAFSEHNQQLADRHNHPLAYFAPDMDVLGRTVELSVQTAQRRRQEIGKEAFAQAAKARAGRVYAAWGARDAARHAQE